MGVCAKRITCLSMDRDNERYYPSKVCNGDIVTLFFNNGGQIQGRVINIKSDVIVIEDINTHEKNAFAFRNINSFNRDFRGELSKTYFMG